MGGRSEESRDWSGVADAAFRYANSKLKLVELAEDIAQEAILRCMEYSCVNEVASIYALAFRIVDNLIIDHARFCRRQGGELQDDMICNQPMPDQIAADRQEVARLSLAIQKLPPLRREVFLRRRLHGQSYAVIGKELQLTSKAIEKHISRALDALNKLKSQP